MILRKERVCYLKIVVIVEYIQGFNNPFVGDGAIREAGNTVINRKGIT